jgi:cbb3-type cytochrome oxidase maturation protein
MEVIFIVLPLAIILAGVAVAAFLWAVRRGQYDDLDGPPCRVLFEDDDAGRPNEPAPRRIT